MWRGDVMSPRQLHESDDGGVRLLPPPSTECAHALFTLGASVSARLRDGVGYPVVTFPAVELSSGDGKAESFDDIVTHFVARHSQLFVVVVHPSHQQAYHFLVVTPHLATGAIFDRTHHPSCGDLDRLRCFFLRIVMQCTHLQVLRNTSGLSRATNIYILL